MELSHPLSRASSQRRLEGRVGPVTGGSRGIGAAIARRFAAERAAVAIVHIGDEDSASATCEAIRQSAAQVIAIDCDVSDEQAVDQACWLVEQRLGPVDLLVNCAGVGGGGAFESFDMSLWHRTLAVNLTGAFLMSQRLYAGMKSRSWGRIINISSQMAFTGGPHAAAYCASKAGLIGLTRSLAVEAAPYGVLVNAIAPGATLTDMLHACGDESMAKIKSKIPLGRFAEPDEIAMTAVMLASSDGDFYVGQTLSPNGGDVLR